MSSMHSALSIRERAQATDYAAQALEAVTLISQAADPPQLLDRLVRATAAIGAAGSVFTASIPEGGPELSCFTLFACHPAIAQLHGNKGLLLNHPWFRFAKTHTMPGTDHQLDVTQDADATAVQLAGQHGFKSCLIIPSSVGAQTGRSEMLCIGSETADDFEGSEARVVRSLARALAAELHDWLTRHLMERLRTAAHLHTADVTLLALEWQGFGTKEIALRTGMTESSVNSRFQRINIRLGCSNRKYSAKRAAAYGLLEPS